MRVLILGPKNTPYENAPFLFDFSLGGGFPNEPPEAFFHSWTPGGSGARINPNLYVYNPSSQVDLIVLVKDEYVSVFLGHGILTTTRNHGIQNKAPFSNSFSQYSLSY